MTNNVILERYEAEISVDALREASYQLKERASELPAAGNKITIERVLKIAKEYEELAKVIEVRMGL